MEFKRWMADSAPVCEQAKRNRDARQAQIVQELLDENLLVLR